MTKREKQARFIQLRAENLSYSQIATNLNISKSTCSRWNKKFKHEIDKQDIETIEQLYKQYKIVKEARIKSTLEILRRIDLEIQNRNFAELSLDKLLSIKLKYLDLLKDDFEPEVNQLELPIQLTQQSLLLTLRNLLEANQHGYITNQKMESKTKILMTAMKMLKDMNISNDDKNMAITFFKASELD